MWKKWPKIQQKRSVVEVADFLKEYSAAITETVWRKEDSKLPGGILTSKNTEINSQSLKRKGKKFSSYKAVEEESTKTKFDAKHHIILSSEKSEEKIVRTGVGIKKQKSVKKLFEKTGLEQQNLYEGKDNTLVRFDHTAKEYEYANQFDNAEELDSYFQAQIKNSISYMFSLHLSEMGIEKAEETTYYVNDKIFTFEYKKTESESSEIGSGTYEKVIKGQINLNPGKYEFVQFESVSRKVSYNKNYEDYLAGDVYEEISSTETRVKAKDKKVNLKYAKASKYTDTYKD